MLILMFLIIVLGIAITYVRYPQVLTGRAQEHMRPCNRSSFYALPDFLKVCVKDPDPIMSKANYFGERSRQYCFQDNQGSLIPLTNCKGKRIIYYQTMGKFIWVNYTKTDGTVISINIPYDKETSVDLPKDITYVSFGNAEKPAGVTPAPTLQPNSSIMKIPENGSFGKPIAITLSTNAILNKNETYRFLVNCDSNNVLNPDKPIGEQTPQFTSKNSSTFTCTYYRTSSVYKNFVAKNPTAFHIIGIVEIWKSDATEKIKGVGGAGQNFNVYFGQTPTTQ